MCFHGDGDGATIETVEAAARHEVQLLAQLHENTFVGLHVLLPAETSSETTTRSVIDEHREASCLSWH